MGFACIYVPDFLLQAVVRGQQAPAGAALALLGGAPPLWSVVAANAAAFAVGIRLGMTKAQVAQFDNVGPQSDNVGPPFDNVGARDTRARSTQVQISFRSEAQEQAAHSALLDAAWSVSPRVEDTAPDTIVLDLQGLHSLFGSEENIAQEIKRRVAAIGLAARIAIAANIEAAIHAARGFPGITIIPAGQERQCLGALPVGILTTGVETLDILERWGISTLQALAALPVLQLSERLGQEGVRLSQLARGVLQRALVLAQASSAFAEEMELDDAVEELEPLSFLLGRLLDQLCARLEARALAVRAVRVRFQLQPSFEKDFQPLKEEVRTKPPVKHYEKLLTLPVPLRNPKTLLKLLRLQLQNDPPAAHIQKIYMTADAAGPRVTQNGLFIPTGPDPEKLELTIARLAKLVGQTNVGRVRLEDSHRPESFRLEHFTATLERAGTGHSCPRKPDPKSIRPEHFTGKGTGHPCPRKPTAKNPAPAPAIISSNSIPTIVTALRILRPPQPLRVELRNAQPARVYLHGMRGKVIAASGPWRTSGDWWQPDSWHHDEWDLEIEFPPAPLVVAQHAAPFRPSSQVAAQLYPEQRQGNVPPSPRQGKKEQSPPNKSSHPGLNRGLYRIYFDTLRQTWFLRGEYD